MIMSEIAGTLNYLYDLYKLKYPADKQSITVSIKPLFNFL